MENTHLTLKDIPGKEFVFRTGEAPSNVELRDFSISGDIDAPAAWVSSKEKDIDAIKAHAVVSLKEKKITLVLNNDQENGRRKSTVVGKITLHQKFESFRINSNYRWDLTELANHIKFNRRFFINQALAMDIVSKLKAFKANVTREIEKTSDDRGNLRQLQDKKVTIDIPDFFTLKMPIIEGDKAIDFDVEICVEEKEGVVRAFLQSISAEEKLEDRISELINAQIPVFKTAGITVIKE